MPEPVHAIEVWCVGGAHVDYVGQSSVDFIKGTSNPGTVRRSFGGVAYNIARELSDLGAKVCLVGAVGEDGAGQSLTSDLEARGIGNQLIRQEQPTGAYLAIEDEAGNLVFAVSDLTALEELSRKDLARALADKPAEAILLLDANLTEAQMSAVLDETAGSFVAVEAISIAKISRVKNHLDRINALFCNLDEANALLGTSFLSAVMAAGALGDSGPEIVSVTHGSEPAGLSHKGQLFERRPQLVKTGSTNGAGDRYTAALLYQLMSGQELAQAMAFAMRRVHQFLESSGSRLN